MKAIELHVDDHEENVGNIADGNLVSGNIAADWGLRVRRRLEERGIKTTGITITNNGTNSKANDSGYDTPISRIEKIIHSPESAPSPERDVKYGNNLRNQIPGCGGDEPDDGDEGPAPRCQEEGDQGRKTGASSGDSK